MNPQTAVIPGCCEHIVAGERVVMLPERALWLPEHRTLLVADLHWGKAAAIRAAHVPVPTGTTAADLARLTQAIGRTGATRLVVLGDLLHARHGRHPDTLSTIADWRSRHAALRIDLVRGNHDAHAGDPPADLEIQCTSEVLRIGAFVGVHEPTEREDGYVIAGHLHPHVSLGGRGRQHVRLPACVFGPRVGVLPAFSSFTGSGMHERSDTDTTFVIAGDEVLPVRTRS